MTSGHVVVTGADGFVGRALMTRFAELGWRVTGVDRTEPGATHEGGVQSDHVVADLTQGVPDDLEPADLIVHGAWITSDPATLGLSDLDYLELNLAPLFAMLRYVQGHLPRAFVFLSSSGVFAADDATSRLTEAHHASGDGPYAIGKRAAELLVLRALAAVTQAHVVRLGYLFGPDERVRPTRTGVSPIATWIRAARAGGTLEVRADNPVRDWTYAADLADALERIVAQPARPHPVHLTSGRLWHDHDLAQHLCRMAGGGEVKLVPATSRLKPPMAPTRLPALADMPWTDFDAALSATFAAVDD